MTNPRVSLIAAVAENGVIGRDGAVPWHLSSDLKRFKAITMGKPIVMGRKTFASIGRPLPGRTNIVVSRQKDFASPGVVVAPTLDAAMAAAREQAMHDGVDEVFVTGGAEIYPAALPEADRLYITHVAMEPAGDAVFPEIDPEIWREVVADGCTGG